MPDSDSIERLLRKLTPQVLGTVVRKFRDFSAVEDAVQEASLAAAIQWPLEGRPDNPQAWLTRVAIRRMIDQIRSETARHQRESLVGAEAMYLEELTEREFAPHKNDTINLFFMCCHPALTPSSAIALTLRAIGGLTTAQIAGAFFVPETTMAQRISRAKQNIKASGIPFQVPNPRERRRRLRSVLHVLYLMFNEGYMTSSGMDLQRTDLSQEALRLSRIFQDLQPEVPEVSGLLSLMLLTDARSRARTNADGELVPLDKQNRALWNKVQIAEGIALLSATLPKGAVGPYQLQAAIAAVHDEAASFGDTDWPQILALYDLLNKMSDNPMVALNRAIAFSMVNGPAKGLELLKTIDGDLRLSRHYRLEAVRAYLLQLAGDNVGSIQNYHAAAGKTGNLPERNYLLAQAARLSAAKMGDKSSSDVENRKSAPTSS